MIGKTIQPEIEALIGERDFATLRAALEDLPSPDVLRIALRSLFTPKAP